MNVCIYLFIYIYRNKYKSKRKVKKNGEKRIKKNEIVDRCDDIFTQQFFFSMQYIHNNIDYHNVYAGMYSYIRIGVWQVITIYEEICKYIVL